MRRLGLDLGERRIGIAVSDPLGITAQGISVYERKGSRKQEVEFFQNLIHTYEVKEVILGLPKNMNGSEGPAAEKARSFGEWLTKQFGITVVYWDERLSTSSAQQVMIEADVSRRNRKGKIDQLAATIILQNYLDFKCKQVQRVD
ncbi:MAG TPA: Holliday junction resolvase RuvX [Bacillota bacterium]|nr:Holliday junction resolvase RuvX [Bacillota bacterium]